MKEELFHENTGLVHFAIRKVFPSPYSTARKYNMDYEDFVQHGLMTLWKCVQKFDNDKANFSTYAVVSIKGSLMSLIRDKGYALKYHYKTTKEEKEGSTPFSLDNELLEDGENFYNVIEDENVNVLDDIEKRDYLKYQLSQLKESEEEVIKLFLVGLNPREVANIMGVSRQRVQQIRKRALERLGTWEVFTELSPRH
jgi:RNA polymerase sigma factor FliA